MSEVKVRFAPSPTGHMHIGNTRTALFNWLLAQKLGGSFMLRIDDTDKERSKKEYEAEIRDALQWLGLVWSSEARQSARTERYREVTAKLIAEGLVYPCYETPEELERLTKSQRLTVIDEAALGFENTVIARRTLIDHYPQADIAAEIGYDRSVVSRRSRDIFARLIDVARILHMA